jgi:hypothetical protein
MNDRHCDREAIRAGRKADLKMYGVIFDAIVVVWRRNGCCSRMESDCRSGGVFQMLICDW